MTRQNSQLLLVRHAESLGNVAREASEASDSETIAIDVRDLAQLDQAFSQAATRAGTVEAYHSAVYASVRNTTFALYRDFPDPVRKRE